MPSQMYKRLRVKYPLFSSYFSKPRIFSTGFRKKKHANTKFNENPSSGSRGFFFHTRERWTDGHDEAISRFSV